MPRKPKSSSRFASLRAKSPFYWVKLVVWFSLVGYVAWLSFIHAVANITWQQNPDVALRFVPNHPLALSRKADELFSQSQSPATLKKVEAMAKESLRGGALNPVAIRLLGYVAEVRGDRKKARELMLLSQKVSRRDFGTQLWLIEDAVERGDKKQALYHYNIALRTTPRSFDLLIPTLIGALDDPEVRSGLVPYVKEAPDWLPTFLNQAISTATDPKNVADVLMRSGRLPDRPEYTAISNQLLSVLAAKSEFFVFQRYYLSLAGAQKQALYTAGLNRSTVNIAYPPAGWQVTDSAVIGGSFSAFDKSGAAQLSAFAQSGERGELMRKYLFLEPGNYEFSANYQAESDTSDAEIRWEMQCLSASANISKWINTTSVKQGPSAAAQAFSLGSECKYQLLTLQLAGGSNQLGMEFTLQSVSIKRRS